MLKLLTLSVLFTALTFTSCERTSDGDNISAQDRAFVKEITLSHRGEISLANLALQKATDTSVRTFARLMLTEHNLAETQLNNEINGLEIDQTLDSLDASTDSIKTVLGLRNGKGFDTIYIKHQVVAHNKAVAMVQNELNGGTNRVLMSYAEAILPKIQTHLVIADTIARRLR